METQKFLNLHDIIQILSEEKIIFTAEIPDYGKDTEFDCIVFEIRKDGGYKTYFDYTLDIEIHGNTIFCHKNNRFYTPKTKEEFLELIK